MLHFTVVAKKLYGKDYLAKVKELFSGLSFEGLYYSTATGGDLKRSLSLIVLIVYVNLDK